MIGLPDKHDLTEFTHLGKHQPTEVSQYAHTLTNFHIQNLWNAPRNILLPTCLFVECSFSCSILSLSYRLIQFLDNSIQNVTWGCTLGNDGISERTANIFKYTITFHSTTCIGVWLNCCSDFFLCWFKKKAASALWIIEYLRNTCVSSVRWQRFQLSALKRERECQYIQTRGAVNRETFSISSRKIWRELVAG